MNMADPEDRHALLQSAQTLRAARRVSEALAVLDRLQARYPGFSRLYEERGQCHILLGNAPAAVAALRHAVQLNPTLPASWNMLAQLYHQLGDARQAAAASAQLAALRQLPLDVVMANSLLADGDFVPAEAAIRNYLHAHGETVGALRLLARIRTALGDDAEAEALLETVLERAPDYHAARLDHAQMLLQQQKHAPARAQAKHLLQHDPHDRAALKLYAAACIGMGDHEAVIDVYARLLAKPALAPGEIAELRQWRATALKVTGRQAEAIADYRAALAAQPDYGVAWFGLANLKTYRFTAEDIARMRAAEAAADIHDMDRIYLCFALGKALEDHGAIADSWHSYARGNACRRAHSRYRPDTAQACVERLKSVCTTTFFADRFGWGVDDPAPIFILGLPRSGSTLIEQILASHSHVEGTQELIEIGRSAQSLCGADPDCGLPLDIDALARLTAAEARALGAHYLAETRSYRRLGRPLFIDKMPNNFWHIGLIQLILPNATIIDVRREPMACCVSNFKQLFGTTNQEFSYGLDDMAHYYRLYLDLMQHWDSVLPGRVLRVSYEDVVEDLEGSVRRLLAQVGLPFEPGCLAFHENRRSVRTPSSEQVRQPIGRDGLAPWRPYAAWLAPLRDALGPALTDYRS